MESMLYIVDNALNYLIYLFIIHFGWKINARKNKLYPVLSVVVMFSAGIFNGILDSNTFIVYIICIAFIINGIFTDVFYWYYRYIYGYVIANYFGWRWYRQCRFGMVDGTGIYFIFCNISYGIFEAIKEK